MFDIHVNAIEDILSTDDITSEFKNNIESFLALSFGQTFGIGEFNKDVYTSKMNESLKNKSQLFINTLRLFYIHICKIQKREIDYDANKFLDSFFKKIKTKRYYSGKSEIQISRQYCNNTLYFDSLSNEIDLVFKLNKKELKENGSVWITHSASGLTIKDKLVDLGIESSNIIVFKKNTKNKLYNNLIHNHHIRNEVVYSYLKKEMDNGFITKKTFNFFIALERSFSKIPIATNFNEVKSFLKLNNFVSIFLDKDNECTISAMKEYLGVTDEEIKNPELIEDNLRWNLISEILYGVFKRIHALHIESRNSLIEKINNGKHIVFNFSDPLMNIVCYQLLINEIYFSEKTNFNDDIVELSDSSFFIEQPLVPIDGLLVSPCSVRGLTPNKFNLNTFYKTDVEKEELWSALVNSSNIVLPENIDVIKTKKDIIFSYISEEPLIKIIIR